MKLAKFALVLPAIALINGVAFADEPGQQAQRPQQPQQQDYPPQQDQFNPEQQYYCNNNCAMAPMPYPPMYLEAVPLPPPIVEPPPVIIPPPVAAPLPCGVPGCGGYPPVVGPPPVLPPVMRPPTIMPRPTPYGVPGYGYGRPGYGYGRPGYGYGRPGVGGPGVGRPGPGIGPRPTPYNGGAGFRRMSLGSGCEIQRGNNGQVVVLTADDAVIYSDRSLHAEENAKAMKAYYEKSGFGFCDAPAVNNAPATQDI